MAHRPTLVASMLIALTFVVTACGTPFSEPAPRIATQLVVKVSVTGV